MAEERIWGEGPEGERDVLLYINETPALLSMLYDLNLLPEQHPDPESKERWMIFNIVNHWREHNLAKDEMIAGLLARPEGAKRMDLDQLWQRHRMPAIAPGSRGTIYREQFDALMQELGIAHERAPQPQEGK